MTRLCFYNPKIHKETYIHFWSQIVFSRKQTMRRVLACRKSTGECFRIINQDKRAGRCWLYDFYNYLTIKSVLVHFYYAPLFPQVSLLLTSGWALPCYWWYLQHMADKVCVAGGEVSPNNIYKSEYIWY